MAQDFICDPETGEIVAILRGGEVFRDDGEGARIATVLGTYIYDLKGNLIGHLQGRSVTDARTRSMPIAFRELLEGDSLGKKKPAQGDLRGAKVRALGFE